jgi:DNA-binding NarL/FixJ family response regulator
MITDAFENGSGIRAISVMRRECAGLRVVMLTGNSAQESERAAMMAGAHAYIVNDSPIEVLLRAIRAENAADHLVMPVPAQPSGRSAKPPAAAGGITPCEREVLIRVALGYSSKRIAADLGRSVKTIEKHRFKMMHKLGLRNAAAVARYAMDNGLLSAGSEARDHPRASPPPGN